MKSLLALAAFLSFAPAAFADGRTTLRGTFDPTTTPYHASSVNGLKSTILHFSGSHYHPKQPGDTPGWILRPSPGSTATMISVRGQDYAHETSANGHPLFKVSNLGEGQVLDVQGLIPVSGHVIHAPFKTKNETAEHFGKTNCYHVVVTHPDGKSETIDNIEAKGLVTGVHLGIKMQKGNTKLQFYPQGSAGVSGYGNGRTIELEYDGS